MNAVVPSTSNMLNNSQHKSVQFHREEFWYDVGRQCEVMCTNNSSYNLRIGLHFRMPRACYNCRGQLCTLLLLLAHRDNGQYLKMGIHA